MAWIKCPRCELNYINEATEQYCKVCLVDMGKISGTSDFDIEENEYRLCPECGENYLEEGEDRCYTCRLEHMKLESKEALAHDTDDSLDVFEELSTDLPETTEEVLVEDVAALEYPEEDEEEPDKP